MGLLIREVRDYLGKPSIEETAEIEELEARFKEGYAKYLATGASDKSQSTAADISRKIDINHASVVELQQLNGIGPVLAKKIIDYRDKNGYFQTVQDLVKVKGIGPKLLLRWEDQLAALPDTNFMKGTAIE